MDWAQRWLLTFLASVVATVYWLFAARARSAAKSRRQSQVAQDHRPDHSVPERTKDQTRKRLTIVYPEQTRVAADDAEVDIVAVHGLGSDADWSWICKDGKKHINWLRDPDMLPALVPKARIIVYRYESSWHLDAPKTRLQLCGEELVHSLHSFRASYPSRPLVFVGHSLGGNVIVQAFLSANDDSKYESLVKTTVGIVFLGTPFRGSKWQPLADALAQLVGPAGSHRGITRELGFDEPALRDRVHRFCKLRNKLSTAVACFTELHETDYGRRLGIAGVAKRMVVDETSACIPGLDRYALDKDHLKINKYYGPTDPAFERVSDVISEMCHRANDVVRRRFERREIITDNHEAGACLHDLFVTDPLDDKKALKRKKGDRAAGTCEWILGTDDLTAWLGPSRNQNSESHATQFLWLHGNPGTGKSTLAIYLTDELSTDFTATDGKTLAFFFCDSAFDTRRTATSVVRGLLLQLIQQHPPLLSYVLPKYNERKAKLFESFDALWTIFILAAADRTTGRKYCIIDALDECDDESQKTLLRQLRETFHSPDAPPNVQFLVTSRPYPEIRQHLEIFANKDLASFPHVKRDIDQCIKERVAQLKYTDKIKGRVTEILKDKAGGTFLWVGIACNELEDTPSKDAISCIEAMPSGLHSLYEKLFSAALEKEREKGTIRLVLGFVAVSRRPLNLLELAEACRLRRDEDDTETRTQFMREYIESCRLMVVIQDETVLLLHQSVKDYLIKDVEKAHFSEFQAHADLAYRCIDHLIEQFQDTKQTHAHFSDYATCEWPNHAHMAQSRFIVMPSQAEFFNVFSPCRESWLAAYRCLDMPIYDKPPRRFSILHVAARWGIPAIAEHVSHLYEQHDKEEELIHLTDASHETPLECAARMGYPAVVRILLGLGSVITGKVTLLAARNRKNGMEVMALFLEQRGDEIAITDEVVVAAAENGKNGREVMALLFKQLGDEIIVTENVVKAAAGNEDSGMEVMALLL
ncbi:vegetative incompatibility protein HET-E-1 [Beauveria bassiana ARSEF 2860]|uniref:Vegetative incompatibility protein HET-E-1 n=1 Tax=Beauveria bassiana (strain ARSEF 2860) TaxID=655819 RepID=J4UGL2_BEAB2|nr:vegetative incompatibility protein HET-E-1 [Beauveria bassiana ARSEF 2860]EJP62037.1 vegetative incompatibility protein HET-E-1 [Beauveria bassiana ARSEF 2860]